MRIKTTSSKGKVHTLYINKEWVTIIVETDIQASSIAASSLAEGALNHLTAALKLKD